MQYIIKNIVKNYKKLILKINHLHKYCKKLQFLFALYCKKLLYLQHKIKTKYNN